MRTENFTIAYGVRIAFGSKLKLSLAIIKVMHPTTIYDNRICCGSQWMVYAIFSVQCSVFSMFYLVSLQFLFPFRTFFYQFFLFSFNFEELLRRSVINSTYSTYLTTLTKSEEQISASDHSGMFRWLCGLVRTANIILYFDWECTWKLEMVDQICALDSNYGFE